MQLIEEYGKGKGRMYGNPDSPGSGLIYHGRGFVQLTWCDNYAKMSRVIGADLVTYTELALDLANASIIAFYGMINGSFARKKFNDYFNDQKSDWINARRIINTLDKANIIAEYGIGFYASISNIPG